MKRILIFGAGGHGRVICDTAQCAGFEVVGFIDDTKELQGQFIDGVPVLGSFLELPQIMAQHKVQAGVVALGDNWVRNLLVNKIIASTREKNIEFEFQTIIHPSAVVSKKAVLGMGCVIMAGAVIQVGTKIGDHCIINTMASVDHDGYMGNFSSVAPGAILGGNVKLGEYSAIGLGAKVIHKTQIFEHVVIGAGSLVNRNISSHVVAYGVPAKIIRSRAVGERYL